MTPLRFALTFLLAFCLVGCGEGEQGVPVSLRGGHGGDVAPVAGSEDLRFGIGAMISPGATIELYGHLVEELGRRLGRRGIAVQRGSYAEINDLLEKRRLSCALVCTGAFVAGQREFGMEALVVPVFGGHPTYNSIIIVREESGILSLENLRGRKFAFVDPLSNTGRFYPISRLLSLGEEPEDFFVAQYTHGHDRSIQAVRSGIVDGAAVDELVFEYIRRTDPQALEGLKIVDRSPPFGAPPVVVHPLTTAAERSRLREAFLALPESESGRTVLAGLGIDRFMAPPANLYESAIALEETVRKYEAERRKR